MRAGDIVALAWNRVDVGARAARLERMKNGTSRDLPLSSQAVRLRELRPKADPIFDPTSVQLASLFKKISGKVGVEDLTSHDRRHEAIMRRSSKLGALGLVRMVGHRDLKLLLTYYDESTENLENNMGYQEIFTLLSSPPPYASSCPILLLQHTVAGETFRRLAASLMLHHSGAGVTIAVIRVAP